ncbi:hypothetical protein BHM03_00059040, partial [Ensete ventricosum]
MVDVPRYGFFSFFLPPSSLGGRTYTAAAATSSPMEGVAKDRRCGPAVCLLRVEVLR